jgi:hypothetical protein
MRRFIIAGTVLGLAACTTATVDRDIAKAQSVVAQAATDIGAACGAVNAAAGFAAPFSAIPQVGSILMFATASCGGADAIAALTAKAINDPSTVAWAQNLAAQIKTLADRLHPAPAG